MHIKDIKRLSLGLTSACNGKCLMCWHSNKEQHKVVNLEKRIYEQIRDSLFHRINHLNLCGGGEFAMYPQINSVLRDVREYELETDIITNFSHITDEQRDILKDMDIMFKISIDGSTKEIQETLRPGCSYDKIIDNVLFFKKHKKRMEFQTVVSELNSHDLKNILILAERLGIDSVHFQELQYYDGLERPYKLNRQKENVAYVEHITNKKNIVISCLASARFYVSNKFLPSLFHPGQCEHTIQDLRVQEDGKILSCCFPGCKVMGDLHKNTLEEIIGSKEFDAHMKSCKCKFSGVKFARPKLFSSKE